MGGIESSGMSPCRPGQTSVTIQQDSSVDIHYDKGLRDSVDQECYSTSGMGQHSKSRELITGSDPLDIGGDPSGTGGNRPNAGGNPSDNGGDCSHIGHDPSNTGGDPSNTGGDPSNTGGDPSNIGSELTDTSGDPPHTAHNVTNTVVKGILDYVVLPYHTFRF